MKLLDRLAEKRDRAKDALAKAPAPAAPPSTDFASGFPADAKRIPIQPEQAAEFLRIESEIAAASARIKALQESHASLARFALGGAGLNTKQYAVVGIDGLETESQQLIALPIEQLQAYQQRAIARTQAQQ